MKKRHQQDHAKKGVRPESNKKSSGTRAQASVVKDSPEMDENHDENRRNMYDPEVAESLKIQKTSGE